MVENCQLHGGRNQGEVFELQSDIYNNVSMSQMTWLKGFQPGCRPGFRPGCHFYCAKQLCSRGLGDRNSVGLSLCPTITCVLCDETIERTADILIPHEREIILVF